MSNFQPCDDAERQSKIYFLRDMLFKHGGRKMSVRDSLTFYVVVTAITAVVGYVWMKLRVWPTIICAAITGQIFLNTIFMPVRLDFWSEFDSWTALYTLIQCGTPLVVAFYAITAAIRDTRVTTSSHGIPAHKRALLPETWRFDFLPKPAAPEIAAPDAAK